METDGGPILLVIAALTTGFYGAEARSFASKQASKPRHLEQGDEHEKDYHWKVPSPLTLVEYFQLV